MPPEEIEMLRNAIKNLKGFERWAQNEFELDEMEYEEHRAAVEQLRYELEMVTDSLYKHVYDDSMRGVQHSEVIDLTERQQERLKDSDRQRDIDYDNIGYIPVSLDEELDEVEDVDEDANIRDIIESHVEDEERKQELLDRYLH